MLIEDLRCEYCKNPLGIDVLRPRFSWRIKSSRRGARQLAYQVIAGQNPASIDHPESILWDSGKVDTAQSIHIPYAGPELQSRQRVYWKVRIWDETDQPIDWSAPVWFEMGLLHPRDWQAQWIGNPLVGGPRTSVPSPFFKKGFSVNRDIQHARLYITSLGIYEAYINGQRLGTDIFSPGWTDYNKRVQYQTYDVTDLLNPGNNVLSAMLGDGWYCGHVAWQGRQLYGDRPKLKAQLEIRWVDGSVDVIVTDESWTTAVGPILEADLIMGEAYDARLELPDWSTPEFSSSSVKRPDPWVSAISYPHPEGLNLVAQNTPTIKVQDELTPISEPALINSWPIPDWVFDFGQNLVGRVRLKVKGERGATIILRFGEMLAEDGTLYTENLRSARQTDYYTLKGDPNGEIYESHFTFHGFRYVQINGLCERPARDILTAVVLHSDYLPALEFECSDPLLNQLQQNIMWGWKGNSVDVPTDCPQRDERLGWTGDAQVFAKTATYLTDAASFFTKWMQDMADAQLPHGAIPSVAPWVSAVGKTDAGPAWSDAFIIIPWTIWQQYGDTRILETHYQAMCRYMDYLVEYSPGLIRLLPNQREMDEANRGGGMIGGYGDWLALDGSTERPGLTPKDLIGTAFLAYDAQLMSQIAAALNKPADWAKYNQLFKDTRTAFINHFLTPDGLLAGQTQTGYVLALYFDLVPAELRPNLIDSLVRDIEVTRDRHMSTGFVGTPYICQVLSDSGYLDLAYTLLLQKTFPSWLYSVLHGATTIWERWDGWTEDRGFQTPSMNSFNHYAYGAVGTWMYENITGIRSDPASPGFKNIIFYPKMSGEISYARAAYQSPYGLIHSSWRLEPNSLIWEVVVPPNTTGTAYIPADDPAQILEGATPLGESNGIKFLYKTERAIVVALQSGSYRFMVSK